MTTRRPTARRCRALGVAAAMLFASGGCDPGSTASTAPTLTGRPGASGATSVGTGRGAAVASATAFRGLPYVGTLFSRGLDHPHGCTATVVASAAADTILTAAHCLRHDERGVLFAPGYRNGATPYGVWRVRAVTLSAGWLRSRDIDQDVAVLTVADRRERGRTRTLQQTTGAAVLADTPPSGSRVTVVAYDRGRDDEPVRCAVPISATGGRLAFACHGFSGGSSGAPWLVHPLSATPAVVSVIGGLHGGGCTEASSNGVPFTGQVQQLVRAAARDPRTDLEPPGPGDGC